MNKTVRLAKLAMMVAISCVLVVLIRIPFPPAPFLEYDPADVPIYITTFAFGPGAGTPCDFDCQCDSGICSGRSGRIRFSDAYDCHRTFRHRGGLYVQTQENQERSNYGIDCGSCCNSYCHVCVQLLYYTSLYGGADRRCSCHDSDGDYSV